MSRESKIDRTDGRELLRELLIRLQDETRQRIKSLRRDQEQESESGPGDEMDWRARPRRSKLMPD